MCTGKQSVRNGKRRHGYVFRVDLESYWGREEIILSLLTHGKTEKHRRNSAPFSNIQTLFDADVSSVKVDTSVKVT